MNTELVSYEVNSKTFEGLHVKPEAKNAPCVLIAHTWAGRDGFVEGIANKLADDGYNAFAIDMYGDGKVGGSNEENQSMMQPLLDDRKNLSQIIVGAYEAAKKLEGVDTSNIAIMGYCFGGLVSLDLARSGVDLKGAVSFHGFLSGSEDLEDKDISAKLLVLHGHLDPMVGQDQIDSFSEEMNKKVLIGNCILLAMPCMLLQILMPMIQVSGRFIRKMPIRDLGKSLKIFYQKFLVK